MVPAAWLLPVEQLAISGQSQQRPAIAIHIVFEVEDLGKTGAGDLVFSPGTVGILGANQILNAAAQAWQLRVIKRAKPHHRPGGLGSGAGPLAFEDRVIVGVAAFAPPAVLVL